MKKYNNEIDGFKFSFKDQQQCQTLTPKFQSIEISNNKLRNVFSQKKQQNKLKKQRVEYSRVLYSPTKNVSKQSSNIGYQTYTKFKAGYHLQLKNQSPTNKSDKVKRVVYSSVDQTNKNYLSRKTPLKNQKLNRLDQFKQYIAKNIQNKNSKKKSTMHYFNSEIFNDKKINLFKQKSQRSRSLDVNQTQDTTISNQKQKVPKKLKNFKRLHTIQTKYFGKEQEQQFMYKFIPKTMKHKRVQHQIILKSAKTPKQSNYEKLKQLNRKILLNNTKALFTSQKTMRNLNLNNVQFLDEDKSRKQQQEVS